MVRTLITGLQKTSQQYIRFAFSEKATGLCSGISPATSVSSQAVFNGTSLHNIRDGIKHLLKVAQVKLVIKALDKSKYQKGMRTIKGVSIDTGLSHEEVQEIINELGEQVIKSGKWVKLNRPG